MNVKCYYSIKRIIFVPLFFFYDCYDTLKVEKNYFFYPSLLSKFTIPVQVLAWILMIVRHTS